jgi:ComF family protein
MSVAVDAPVCRQCQKNPLSHIDGIRSASYFEDNPVRAAVHFLKYRNHKAISAILAGLLADAYRRYQLVADVVVPVPLHPARFRERGYNQSELLARELSKLLGLGVNTTTLRRARATRTQMTLNQAERHQNVAGAFAYGDLNLTGQRVLLIDDVCTTGSTLQACADALKQSGVVAVWGLTLARAS